MRWRLLAPTHDTVYVEASKRISDSLVLTKLHSQVRSTRRRWQPSSRRQRSAPSQGTRRCDFKLDDGLDYALPVFPPALPRSLPPTGRVTRPDFVVLNWSHSTTVKRGARRVDAGASKRMLRRGSVADECASRGDRQEELGHQGRAGRRHARHVPRYIWLLAGRNGVRHLLVYDPNITGCPATAPRLHLPAPSSQPPNHRSTPFRARALTDRDCLDCIGAALKTKKMVVHDC